jgi:hypothetical protein
LLLYLDPASLSFFLTLLDHAFSCIFHVFVSLVLFYGIGVALDTLADAYRDCAFFFSPIDLPFLPFVEHQSNYFIF